MVLSVYARWATPICQTEHGIMCRLRQTMCRYTGRLVISVDRSKSNCYRTYQGPPQYHIFWPVVLWTMFCHHLFMLACLGWWCRPSLENKICCSHDYSGNTFDLSLYLARRQLRNLSTVMWELSGRKRRMLVISAVTFKKLRIERPVNR